ncbi:MAG: GMC family oxidoreductase, partial [Gammaproteobacteria bacterium]
FLRSDAAATFPDIQLHFLPLSSRAPGWKFDRFAGFTVNVCQLRPSSHGRVTLRSANPFDSPSIDPGYLTDSRDLTVLLGGLERVRKILRASPLSEKFGASEARPGPSVRTRHQLLRYVRTTAETVYHPVGSCRMGTDQHAVVDSRLRVRGVPNLWIVDASVMPTLPSGNTNAAVLMIAERGATVVRRDISSR